MDHTNLNTSIDGPGRVRDMGRPLVRVIEGKLRSQVEVIKIIILPFSSENNMKKNTFIFVELCRNLSIAITCRSVAQFKLCKLESVWKTIYAKYPPKSPRIQRLKFGCTQLNQEVQEEHFLFPSRINSFVLFKFKTYLSSQSQQEKVAMQSN